MEFTPPVIARVWKDGGRIFEKNVICVETDGEEVELVGPEDEWSFVGDEWDVLTVDQDTER